MKHYSIGQRKKSRGNLTWYGRTFEDGILVKEESLRTKRKSEAQEWLNSMNALRFLPENLRARLAPVDRPISEATSMYMKYVEGTVSAGSVRVYESKTRTFLTWCAVNGVDTLRGFTCEKAVKFMEAIGNGHSSSTVGDYVTFMNMFASWCDTTFGMEGYDPMKGIRHPKKQKREKAFWTPEQLDDILDNAPSSEFRLYWALMAFAGLRHSEARNLGSTTTVDGGSIRVIGKGDKEAVLPVSDRLKDELERANWRNSFGKRVRDDRYSRSVLKEAVERAGLDSSDATDHKFRHSFISNILRTNKVSAKAVQMLARHSNIRTTMDIYSHLLQEDLTEAVNARK